MPWFANSVVLLFFGLWILLSSACHAPQGIQPSSTLVSRASAQSNKAKDHNHSINRISPFKRGAGVEQLGNVMTFFNEKEQAEASFVLLPGQQNQTKPFQTQFLKELQHVFDQTAVGSPGYMRYLQSYFGMWNYSLPVIFHDIGTTFGPWDFLYGADKGFYNENKNLLLGNLSFHSADNEFFQEHPECRPSWDIYLNNVLIAHHTYSSDTSEEVFIPNNGPRIRKNHVVRIEQTPMQCIRKVENNRLTEHYTPVSKLISTQLLSYCIDNHAGEYCTPDKVNFRRGQHQADVFVSAEHSQWLNGFGTQILGLYREIHTLQQDTFGHQDFEIAQTKEKTGAISDRALFQQVQHQFGFKLSQVEPSSEPESASSPEPLSSEIPDSSASPSPSPSGSASSEPTPEPTDEATPEPTPTPMVYDDEETEPKDELLMSFSNESTVLESTLHFMQNLIADSLQKNQSIIDEKQESELPADQALVQLAQSRKAKLIAYEPRVTQLKTELNQLQQQALEQSRVKYFLPHESAFHSAPTILYYGYPGQITEAGPPSQIAVQQAYFQPTQHPDNPYGQELVIEGRLINPNSMTRYINFNQMRLEAPGIFANPIRFHLSEGLYSQGGVIVYSYFFDQDHRRFEIQQTSSDNPFSGHVFLAANANRFRLVLDNYRFSDSFIQSRGVNPEQLDDPRLFKSIPIQFVAELLPAVQSTEEMENSPDGFISADWLPIQRYMYPTGELRSNQIVAGGSNNSKLLGALDVPEEHTHPITIDTYENQNGENVLANSEPIFSPRDRNGIYDRLNVDVNVDAGQQWHLRVGLPGQAQEALEIKREDDTRLQGTGSGSVQWDGHLKGICINDGHFELFVMNNQNQVLQSETFYIDNTPPKIVDLNVIETVIQKQTLEQDEIIRNHVTLKVNDLPFQENDAAAGITSIESLKLLVRAEQEGYLEFDPEDFSILGESNKEFTLNFDIEGRVKGRFIEVSFRDDIGNTQYFDLSQEAKRN